MKRLAVGGLILWLSACGAPSGPGIGATFSGTVSNSQGGVINNATVTVTPTGGSALPAAQTATDGTYTVSDIPIGDGSVTVSNLPGVCAPLATIQYTGAKNGGHRTINFTIACTATTLP